MISLDDFAIINQGYFDILQKSASTVTLVSKNTQHQWHIVQYEKDFHQVEYMVFHQHDRAQNFHLHERTYSFELAISHIQQHDHFVIQKYGNKKRHCLPPRR